MKLSHSQTRSLTHSSTQSQTNLKLSYSQTQSQTHLKSSHSQAQSLTHIMKLSHSQTQSPTHSNTQSLTVSDSPEVELRARSAVFRVRSAVLRAHSRCTAVLPPAGGARHHTSLTTPAAGRHGPLHSCRPRQQGHSATTTTGKRRTVGKMINSQVHWNL